MSSEPGGAPRRAVLLAAAVVGLALAPGALGKTLAGPPAASGNGGLPQIVVLSNRADLVSGGDALVQIVLPARVDPATVRVSLDGTDVTSAFAVRPDGRYEGLVTGLAVGANDLMATMRQGPTVHLTITNHPSGGPVFAGPQVQPWICKTFAGFGAPADAQCNTAPVYSYVYQEAGTQTFKAYDPAAPPPAAAIAMTTTDRGTTVPYIVRLEKGAMDRGLYDVAVLADPSSGWAPWAPQRGWNHKVLYQFGGGTAPWHTNGAPQNDLVDMALSRGFLVANNNLNIRGNDANDVVSAEALMMLKEHIAETYGPIRYTIGTGCSGGSIQQHQIAANYPGLLDGHPAELQLPGQLDDGQRGQRLPPAAALLQHRGAGDVHLGAAGGGGGHAGHLRVRSLGRKLRAGRHPVSRPKLQPPGDAVRVARLRPDRQSDRRAL